MISEKQLNEIKEHLERAQNPFFYFDNDNDGLISFLLLQRYLGRGKGISIKSFPELDASYYRKVKELNADYIFILDKPCVSKEFLDKAQQDNIPVVWIDHHDVEKPECENYFNSYHTDKQNEPVSYICYKLTNRKEDLWLAVIGCISDYYMPDFYNEFLEKYPELGIKNPKSPFHVLYESKIGEIARILDFALKDTTTNVVNMLRLMIKSKSPYDILNECSANRPVLRRFCEINSKYKTYMEKARQSAKEKYVYFQYAGEYSLNANLANQLKFEFPKKTIIICYLKSGQANFSIRADNARDITLKAIKDIEGATGGGHEKATGAQVPVDKIEDFKMILLGLIK